MPKLQFVNNGTPVKDIGRRSFLQTSFKALCLSGIATEFLSYLNSPETMFSINDNHDDLQKIKQLLVDKEKPLKWIFAGDSITQGAKHTMGYRCYPEIFAERIRFEMNRPRDFVINSAISGHASQHILDDFNWRIAQFYPDIVSIMIGTNDAAAIKKISADEFRKNLLSLVFRIRNIQAIPILHTPNIIKVTDGDDRKKLPLFVQVVRQVAIEKKIILVDHWSYWETNRDKVFEDGWLNDSLHPNAKGHLEMARLLFKALSICSEPSFSCTADINFH